VRCDSRRFTPCRNVEAIKPASNQIPDLLKYDHVVHAYGFGVTTLVCWEGLCAILTAHRTSVGQTMPVPTQGTLTLCVAAVVASCSAAGIPCGSTGATAHSWHSSMLLAPTLWSAWGRVRLVFRDVVVTESLEAVTEHPRGSQCMFLCWTKTRLWRTRLMLQAGFRPGVMGFGKQADHEDDCYLSNNLDWSHTLCRQSRINFQGSPSGTGFP
jgi:hypothetical protein